MSWRQLSDKLTSPTRCHYDNGRKASRDHRARARGALEIIHSSLDLHGEELSPAPPDGGGPEAKGLFETEAWRVEKSETGRFSGCLDMTAPLHWGI